MTTFLFRCPDTGMIVQGRTAGDEQADNGRALYMGVQCLACQKLHLVNPKTGRLLSEDIDKSS